MSMSGSRIRLSVDSTGTWRDISFIKISQLPSLREEATSPRIRFGLIKGSSFQAFRRKLFSKLPCAES
jgi:hypothetical protein